MRTDASTSGPSTARSSRRSRRGASSATACCRARIVGGSAWRQQPAGEHGVARARARRDEQLEQPAGAEQIEVVGVEVLGIAEPLAALAAAPSTVSESREATLVKGRGARRAIARVQHARVDEEQRDEGEDRERQPRHALRGRATATSADRGDEDRQPAPRQRGVPALRAGRVGSPRGEPFAVDVAYGRTLPSVFHRYSVRVPPDGVDERVHLVRLPVAHAEVVRHDPRAGLQLPVRIGRSLRLDADSRYSVTTVASRGRSPSRPAAGTTPGWRPRPASRWRWPRRSAADRCRRRCRGRRRPWRR